MENDKSNCPVTRGDVDLEWYAQRDAAWVKLGIAAPARRALINLELFQLSELTTVNRNELAKAHGMGPKTMRVLDELLAKNGMQFKS